MRKERGYNLVEIMLALVVLGLLLGGALVPLQVRYQAANQKEAEENLDAARRAIEGYAVINRTVERRALGADGITYVLPAGRPYLPCPDITGDGLEDRQGITLAAAVATLTAFVLENEGGCREQKGLLPWRTLGMQAEADPWGRRYGYRVDVAFSNEILGFDETFRADIFDPRRAAAGENFYQHRTSRRIAGALVCSRLMKNEGCPPVAHQDFLVAGIVTTISLNPGNIRPTPGYTDFRNTVSVEGILDGAAFVVFSHGPNGYGGVNAGNNVCVRPPPDTNNLGERANAYYDNAHFMHEDVDSPINCADMDHPELSENLFVSAPPALVFGGSPDDAYEMDDIVAWTSPNMLAGMLLQSGALPIPKLEFLPEGN